MMSMCGDDGIVLQERREIQRVISNHVECALVGAVYYGVAKDRVGVFG